MGLRYVMIHLDGPVSKTVQTDLDGHYSFNNLPPGIYSLREAHPKAFIDGIDTLGTPALGTVADDIFTGILLTSNVQAVGYNFAERGLTNPNKKLDLASTALDWDLIQPRLPDNQLDTLWAQLFGPPPAPSIYSFQNPRNSLDVNDDGYIAADDVLTIINRINAGPLPATSGPELRSPLIAAPYLDTTGDGIVAADDVLRVINYLNSRSSNAEGESAASNTLLEEGAFTTDDDSLFDLIADDINQSRRKK